MKNVIEVKNNRKQNKITAIFLIIFSLILISMLIFLSIMLANYDLKKAQNFTGIVENVQIDEKDEDNYLIVFENGEKYKITSVISSHLSFDNIKNIEGKETTIYILDDIVIGVETDTIILDKNKGLSYLCNNTITGIIFTSIFAAILISFAILNFYLAHKKMKPKLVDIFRLQTLHVTETPPFYKKSLKWFFIEGFIWFIALIPVLVFGEIDDTSVYFYTFLGIWLGLFVIIFITPFWFLPLMRKKSIPYFNDFYQYDNRFKPETETKKFVFDYFNSIYFTLNDGSITYNKNDYPEFLDELYKHELDEKNYAQFKQQSQEEEYQKFITEEIQSQNPELPEILTFDYKDLKLYTKAVFRPELLTICILSNLDDEKAQGLEYNLMFKLDKDLYYWLEKYNVHVEGLEFCLNNREKLMKDYCKGRIKHITFNDNGIKSIEKPKILL